MMRTFKYRIKDRRAAKHLREHATACNQVYNWCVAQHLDVLARYRAGARSRRWASYFDLTRHCAGLGRELNIQQQTVQVICKQWVKDRPLNFRSSFGSRRARGWVPFQRQCRKIEGNSVTYMGRRYRFFGSKRRPLPVLTKGGAFVEDKLGRWWVCFDVEIEGATNHGSEMVGIDLGLKSFVTTSDGQSFAPVHGYRTIEAKLAVAQRSGNRKRVKALHIHAVNIRRDFHHKLSTDLTARYALIAVGNVNAKRLARTRMSKSVRDAGWSTFRAMLRYKAKDYVEVDEKFTSQTCSCCGSMSSSARPRGIAGLGIREWECTDCGATHDRDVNAARNILNLALSVQRRGDESHGALHAHG